MIHLHLFHPSTGRRWTRFILTTLLLGLVLSACSAPPAPLGPTPAATATAPTATPAPSPTPILPGATGGLARLLERGSLVIGLQANAAAPFVIVDDKGETAGLDIALADAFARSWFAGRANTLAWRTDATIADLTAGRVDLLMGGLVHSRAAEAEIDFSETYWRFGEDAIAIGLPANDSLLRDMVNASLQQMMATGEWDNLVQTATGASPVYTPEAWEGEIPSAAQLAANSQPPAESRLNLDAPLRFLFLSTPGFVTTSSDGNPSGYLPDLARELNRRLTGDTQPVLQESVAPPPVLFTDFDVFLGPQLHTGQLEMHADFSQSFYGDGLALVARPGSKVTSFAQLDRRPVALIETATSRSLYDAARIEYQVAPLLFPAATVDEAVAMLADNKVDAVLIQGYPAARVLAARVPDAILAPGRQGPVLPWVITLPPNDSRLRDAINLALQDMLADGALAQLHSRYFGGDAPYPIETWSLR